MKKTIAILLCALFILSAFPASVFAAPDDCIVTFAPYNGNPPADPPFTVTVASGEKVAKPTPDPLYEG
ncbi:MAG: hypothetical protein FWH57_08905, partial [Oscillospiraceae bacterium]|nr:hypothetical protein [Oscillospiraceae bacterium]